MKYKLPNEISLDLEDREYLILTEKKEKRKNDYRSAIQVTEHLNSSLYIFVSATKMKELKTKFFKFIKLVVAMSQLVRQSHLK